MMIGKKIVVRLLLGFLILISSVLALELLVRIFLPVYDPSGMIEFRSDSDGIPLGVQNFSGRQWKNTGDYNVSVHINRYGFRDKKDLRSSKEDDIFVVGDSFCFGWGVEEDSRFSTLLERKLNIPVYNISAVPANLSTYEKLIKYAQGNGANIKNLIIGICMENDLVNYVPHKRSAKPILKLEKTFRNISTKHRLKIKILKLKPWLAKHSALYHALLSIVHQNEFLKNAAIKMGLIISNYDGMGKNEYSEWVTASSLKKLREITKDFNVTILIIPSRGLWVGNNQDEERHLHEDFVLLLKESGMHVIDMRPVFEEYEDPLGYHFKDDGHWNKKAHQKAAEGLLNQFKKRENL